MRSIFSVAVVGFSFLLTQPVPALAKSLAPDGLLKSALTALERGDLPRSQKILGALVKRHPKKALYWFNLGNVYFKSGQHDAAIRCYLRVIILESPLSPVASLYIARSLRLSGDLAAALREIQRKHLSPLPPALHAEFREERLDILRQFLAEGLKHFDQLEFESSLPYFETVIDHPEDPHLVEQAKLMLGVALFKLERGAEAKEILARLTRSGSNPNVRENSRTVLMALRRAGDSSRFPWWAFLDASLGFNSNVYGTSADDGPSSSAFQHWFAEGGTRLFKRGDYTANWTLGLGADQFYREPAARTIQGNLAAEFTVETARAWRNVSPFLAYETYGPEPYLFRPGVVLGSGRKLRAGEFGLTYTYLKKIPAHSSFQFAEGSIHELRGFYAMISPGEMITSNLLLGHESSGSLNLLTGSIPLARSYLVPGINWKKVLRESRIRRWEINSGLSYQFSFFEQGRQDRQWIGTASLGRWLSGGLRAYAELTFTRNSSTLNSSAVVNKNFTQWIATTGISWDIHQ